jgi:hypothetical protein
VDEEITLVFEVLVGDDQGGSAEAQVKVTVQGNQPPLAEV